MLGDLEPGGFWPSGGGGACMDHKTLTCPRIADSRLLLPLPVLPQTPSMVPCKAKKNRQALGQVTCPGQVYCLLCKMTNRKQLHAPQDPSDKAQEELRGQSVQVGCGNLRGRKLHEAGRKELCTDGPVRHKTQIPDLHLFYSMILGKSLKTLYASVSSSVKWG